MSQVFYSKSIQLLGFCIFFAAFINYYKERTGIEYTQHITENIKMYRDSNGVPNILTSNIADAYFALGFSHAEDRLWQMYFKKKIALGELSELLGEKAVSIDKFARMLNFKELCKLSEINLKIEEKKIIQSYAEGINHYIESTWVLPFEFILFNIGKDSIKWSIHSSCVVEKLLEYSLTQDFVPEMIRTHLLEHLNISKEVIDKLFSFKFESHENQRTIIKDHEMKDLKYKTVIRTQKDIQYAYVNHNEDKIRKEEIIEDAVKVVESLDMENPLVKDGGIGSNNFVISGKLTDNGHPYLGNDPHLRNGMPTIWYFANIKIEQDNLHLTGATIAGVPTFLIGSNSYVAWGITNSAVDVADVLRIEKTDVDEDLNINIQYNNDNKYKFTKREEIFYLNKHKDINNSIKLEFLDSDFGPVINEHVDSLFVSSNFRLRTGVLNENKYYYIMRSPFTDKNDTNLKGLVNIPLSKNLKDFVNKLSYLTISLNVVFIDKEDNIGYHLTGKIPKRFMNEEGAYVRTIKHENDLYSEIIPFDELPNLINPERGYIVSSNNLIISPDYRHLLQGSFVFDSRAVTLEDEIENQIKKGKKINLGFINQNLLGNIKDPLCKEILDFIFTILKNDKIDVLDSFGIGDLEGFDCIMEGSSQNALIFNVLESEILNIIHFTEKEDIDIIARVNVVEAESKENYLIFKLKQYSENNKICLIEYKMTCGELILYAYENSINYIRTHLGNDMSNWKWKNLNVKHYPHSPFSFIPGLRLLSHRTVKSDGNNRTPKISLVKQSYDKTHKSVISSNLKYIVNLYHNETYFSIDSGQNGRIFHRHYDDLQGNSEKGILINFDKNINKDDFTLEFRRK